MYSYLFVKRFFRLLYKFFVYVCWSFIISNLMNALWDGWSYRHLYINICTFLRRFCNCLWVSRYHRNRIWRVFSFSFSRLFGLVMYLIMFYFEGFSFISLFNLSLCKRYLPSKMCFFSFILQLVFPYCPWLSFKSNCQYRNITFFLIWKNFFFFFLSSRTHAQLYSINLFVRLLD